MEAYLPSVDDAIIGELMASNAKIWREVWPAAARIGLSAFGAAQIDPDAATIDRQWLRLDQPEARAEIAAVSSTATEHVIESIMEYRNVLNAAIAGVGHHAQTNSQLRKRLRTVMPRIASQPSSYELLRAAPFPALWTGVADALVRRTAADVDAAGQGAPLAEWRLLNRLLLAGYFESCRLLSARDVQNDLNEKASGLVPVRGKLLRLVSSVTDGVRPTPPVVAPRGAIALQRPGFSTLLTAAQHESERVARGEGFFHRLVGVDHPINPPAEMRGHADAARFKDVRRAMYRQYEHTLVAYMSLGSIEQLLRAWASHLGVSHLSPSGRPLSVGDWIQRLNPSSGLLDRVDELYSVNRSNVRNRFVHGGLFDVEGARAQVTLSAYYPERYPMAAVGQNPYAVENVFRQCANCLEAVEREAIARAIGEADLAWTGQVFLSPDEIELGHQLSADLLGSHGDRIVAQIGDLLAKVSPELGQFTRVALIAWFEPDPPDPLARFMAQVLVFEAIYRLVAHLHGFNVLQRDDDNKRYQYLMLDERGLSAPAVTARLLEVLPERSRPMGDRVLRLAVKARNALAHGAVRTFTADTLDGAGHLILKSIHLLVAGTLRHMIRESAYYRSISDRDGAPPDAVADWLWAQEKVLAAIHA